MFVYQHQFNPHFENYTEPLVFFLQKTIVFLGGDEKSVLYALYKALATFLVPITPV